MIDHELTEAVLAGGYPEALSIPIGRRRQNWYLDYVEAIIRRDIYDIARIEHLQSFGFPVLNSNSILTISEQFNIMKSLSYSIDE